MFMLNKLFESESESESDVPAERSSLYRGTISLSGSSVDWDNMYAQLLVD